jgi:hypothetical protein
MASISNSIRIIPRDNGFLNRNTGSSGEIYFNRDSKSLRLYDGRLRGGFEVVNEDNIQKITALQGIASVTYDVTINNIGAGNKYVLNGIYLPSLNFIVGYSYLFDQNDSTNLYYPNLPGNVFNSHPIHFSSDDPNGELGSGTAYTNNVRYFINDIEVSRTVYNQKFNSSTSRYVIITITKDTPTTLYYYCSNHTNMGSTISVTMPGSAGAPAGGGAEIDVSDNPPSGPSEGSLWFNSTNGILYVFLEDVDSGQWVQPSVPLPNSFSSVTFSDSSSLNASGSDTLNFREGSNILFETDTNTNTVTISVVGVEGGGVDLTAFSIGAELPADGDGSISYDNTAGVFTYTPPDLSSYVLTSTLSNYVQNTALGSFSFTGSVIDTSDSSAITITPIVTLQSDLIIENDIIASNKILAEEFVSTSAAAPVIDSASTLTLSAADAVIVTGAPFRLPRFTDAQRSALTAVNGDVIYNINSNKIEAYQNGSWIELDTGAAA